MGLYLSLFYNFLFYFSEISYFILSWVEDVGSVLPSEGVRQVTRKTAAFNNAAEVILFSNNN